MKSKSLKNIENRMAETDRSSLRYQVLKNAKDFKVSWVELGQILYEVWKDKLYRDWGYQEFETYTSKEIGIRKQTALKLLRSYSFLEKEEPSYLRKEYVEQAEAGTIPTYESVDVLRRASRNKDIGSGDYLKLKRNILEKGRDAREARNDLTKIIKEQESFDDEKADRKKAAVLKRFLSVLKSLKKEIKINKSLPSSIIKETEDLIYRIESISSR